MCDGKDGKSQLSETAYVKLRAALLAGPQRVEFATEFWGATSPPAARATFQPALFHCPHVAACSVNSSLAPDVPCGGPMAVLLERKTRSATPLPEELSGSSAMPPARHTNHISNSSPPFLSSGRIILIQLSLLCELSLVHQSFFGRRSFYQFDQAWFVIAPCIHRHIVDKDRRSKMHAGCLSPIT